jgi:DNA ligase-1
MQILEIFQNLKTLTSVKDKEALLKSNKDNEYLAQLLYMNLNPYMMFYIKAIPPYEPQTVDHLSGKVNYKCFLELAEKLNKRELTGNAAKEAVKEFFWLSNPDEAAMYKAVLLKDAIGVGAKTVNKVWPDHVPEFKLMLAPNELPIITKVKYPTYIQPKLDGFRCVYKDGALWSRTGKPFGNKNLALHFKSLFETSEYVLDGELYAHGTGFNNLQSTLNDETAPIPVTLKYVVYDCVPSKDWEKQTCTIPYEIRLKTLRSLLNDTIADYTKVIDIANDLVDDSKQAIEIYKKYLKNGYEGCMLKATQGFYQWKRVTVKSGEMLKLKPFQSIDVAITGFYAGEGKHEGSLGGIIIITDDNVAVRIGSGFSDDLRKEIWNNQSKYLGKIVEVKYFEKTEDNSFRFPTFERFRTDKE